MNTFLKLMIVVIVACTVVHLYFSHTTNTYTRPQNSGPLKAIVIGASSGIGKALAAVLSKNGYQVGLVARRLDLLYKLQKELTNTSYVKQIDLRQPEEAMKALEELIQEMGGLDIIIINSGIGYSDKALIWAEQKETINVNIIGFTAMANVALNHFTKQNHGHLVGISSIAAIYPGKNGFTYGASKAFESTFLMGLRNTLRSQGTNICITDIKPGFVDTDMVKGVEKRFWQATPDEAAHEIYDAIVAKKEHAYITKRWGLIAFLLKVAPDWLIDKVSI